MAQYCLGSVRLSNIFDGNEERMPVEAYTPEEIAKILKITKHTVYEMIKRGDLKAFKVGNKMRIEESELLAYRDRSMTTTSKSSNDSSRSSIAIRLVGSHDFLLEHFVQYAHTQLSQISIQPSFVGSLEGLMMLYRDQADIAAIHLLNSSTKEYNLPYIKELFPQKEITVLRLASRKQGFIVPKGNPKNFHGFKDLSNGNFTFVNRQSGSGTRILFDQLLKENNITSNQVKGYEREEWNHLATASHVASGLVDVSFGISSSAERLNLDFIPITNEYFDLVFQWTNNNEFALREIINCIISNEFKESIVGFQGYDFSEFGTIIYGKKD